MERTFSKTAESIYFANVRYFHNLSITYNIYNHSLSITDFITIEMNHSNLFDKET